MMPTPNDRALQIIAESDDLPLRTKIGVLQYWATEFEVEGDNLRYLEMRSMIDELKKGK